MDDIKKIVLTGGPCAGKTTALVRIIEHFSGLGFKVFTIPEVPTLMTQAGMNYLTKNQAFFYEGEKATLELQLALEDKFLRMAQQCKKPSVIVCDRGAMDISAYMTPEMWADITRAVGTHMEREQSTQDQEQGNDDNLQEDAHDKVLGRFVGVLARQTALHQVLAKPVVAMTMKMPAMNCFQK